MKIRTLVLAVFLLASMCILSAQLSAQKGPVAGGKYSVVYNPPSASPLSKVSSLSLYYVFDYWNLRYGTRLALWQNVLRPDTTRLHAAPMQRLKDGWTATIDVPADAALLSWIVSDGQHMDGNSERTYVEYVLGSDGKPVRNARYYNVQFLRLGGNDIGTIIGEMEREIADHPQNFPAYHQYFSLLMEQSKGSSKIQERIANRLDEMEKTYGDDDEFLNLAAQTWFYILQDQKQGLAFRERIPPGRHWPQVLRMFDREGKQAEESERQLQSQSRRSQLLNTELPSFNLKNAAGEKVSFPRRDGQPLLVLFWASTSERSLQQIDKLRQILESGDGAGIDVVYVSLDPDEQRAAAVARERGFEAGLLFNQGATLATLGVDSLPTLFVVDSRDIVRTIQVGFSLQQVEELRSLLPTLR